MSAESRKDAAGQPQPRRRPWCRLHFSTWVVLLVLLAALVLIEVPGTKVGYELEFIEVYRVSGVPRSRAVLVRRQQHGWPLVYLERGMIHEIDREGLASALPPGAELLDIDESIEKSSFGEGVEVTSLEWAGCEALPYSMFGLGEEETSPGWLRAESWPFAGGKCAWYPLGIVLDVGICLLICVLVAAVHERWRRGRRRFWQFSLRDLLVFVTLTAALVGWCRWIALEHARESEATAALEAESCQFRRVCVAPVWLAKLVGVEQLRWTHRVQFLECWSPGGAPGDPDTGFGFDRENVEAVAKIVRLSGELKSLEGIDFGLMWDPAVLKPLEGSTKVLSLDIRHECLSEEGARSLATLPNLKRLLVTNRSAGPGSVANARLLPSPPIDSESRVASSPFAGNLWGLDGCLESLHRLPVLETLWLEGYGITDRDFVHLSRAKSLRGLGLDFCGLTDENLAHLADLPRLERLTFSRCQRITDGSIVHLKKLTTLRSLHISGTDITESGAAELRKALPETEVTIARDSIW